MGIEGFFYYRTDETFVKWNVIQKVGFVVFLEQKTFEFEEKIRFH